KVLKLFMLAFIGLFIFSSCDDDDVVDNPDQELTITLRNTLEEGGTETPFPVLFGEAEDAFDEVATFSSDEVEFPTALAQEGVNFMGNTVDLSGLYAIDISESAIEFTLLPSADDPFWSNVFELFPAGKVDRYYFTYSAPHGITTANSNHGSVNLVIASETEIVVEITEGYNMQPGAAFLIRLNGLETLSSLEKAVAFNEGLNTADASVLKWMRDDYIQHNPLVPTGKTPLIGFYTGGVTATVHRAFETQTGEFVFSQITIDGFPGPGLSSVLFEVWRFEDGFAAEHWDNFELVQDDGDGTSQTDGVTTPAIDLDQTDANIAFLEEMSQTLFVDGDWTKVRDYYDVDNYIEHSVGDGTDGSFLESLESESNRPFYDEVKFIHVSGNFGIVASQGPDVIGNDPDGDYAYYDLFRIENGKIIEHWDAVNEIDFSQAPHDNGKW
ncbi:MAG: hypothetical protein AAGA66_20325, partial [Bacteroidota bacterium]